MNHDPIDSSRMGATTRRKRTISRSDRSNPEHFASIRADNQRASAGWFRSSLPLRFALARRFGWPHRAVAADVNKTNSPQTERRQPTLTLVYRGPSLISLVDRSIDWNARLPARPGCFPVERLVRRRPCGAAAGPRCAGGPRRAGTERSAPARASSSSTVGASHPRLGRPTCCAQFSE